MSLKDDEIYEKLVLIMKENTLNSKGITKTELARTFTERWGLSITTIWGCIDDLIESEGAWFILLNDSRVRLSEVVRSSVPIKSVYVDNYNCDDKLVYYTVSVLREGLYAQEFKFDEEILNAKFWEEDLTENLLIK